MPFPATPNPLLSRLRAGDELSFAEVTAALLPHLPLLGKLVDTPQEAEWHAEGNVAVHSALVLERAHELVSGAGLTGDDRATLLLAAALHDIGKALTTREELDNQGVTRLRSRQHARRGRDYLSYRLLDAGFAPEFVLTVLNLVAQHHSLHRALDAALGRGVSALARRVPLPLLVLLARADARGRMVRAEAGGRRDWQRSAGEDAADLLELAAQELGLWEKADPYAAFRAEVVALLPGAAPELLRLAVGRGIQDWEAGVIHTPHEAVARVQEAARQGFPRLTVLCGPSGSGKSTLARSFSEATVISLDALRAQHGKNSSDQSVNGQVLQAAREALREGLRRKKHVVWDATSLRRDQRSQVLGLGHDYGALTEIQVLWVAPAQFSQRNQGRGRVVNPAVLADQLHLLEFPEVDEAHEVTFLSAGEI